MKEKTRYNGLIDVHSLLSNDIKISRAGNQRQLKNAQFTYRNNFYIAQFCIFGSHFSDIESFFIIIFTTGKSGT